MRAAVGVARSRLIERRDHGAVQTVIAASVPFRAANWRIRLGSGERIGDVSEASRFASSIREVVPGPVAKTYKTTPENQTAVE